MNHFFVIQQKDKLDNTLPLPCKYGDVKGICFQDDVSNHERQLQMPPKTNYIHFTPDGIKRIAQIFLKNRSQKNLELKTLADGYQFIEDGNKTISFHLNGQMEYDGKITDPIFVDIMTAMGTTVRYQNRDGLDYFIDDQIEYHP